MTLVSPRVIVVLPAPESPTTPTTIALGTELLVAAAVEQQRRALVLARVLHAAEEERVVPAPVRALHARDEVRQRTLHERRLAHQGEARLGQVLAGAAGEAIRQSRLRRTQNADAVVHPL